VPASRTWVLGEEVPTMPYPAEIYRCKWFTLGYVCSTSGENAAAGFAESILFECLVSSIRVGMVFYLKFNDVG
jgi:hypothetical protein